MGLDIGDAGWSYGGFHRFRTRLAQHIGIELDRMEGFGGDERWSVVFSELVPLLDHSDCDGVLTPAQCQHIAGPLLDAVLHCWQPDDYDWQMGVQLVREMVNAVRSGQDLEFR